MTTVIFILNQLDIAASNYYKCYIPGSLDLNIHYQKKYLTILASLQCIRYIHVEQICSHSFSDTLISWPGLLQDRRICSAILQHKLRVSAVSESDRNKLVNLQQCARDIGQYCLPFVNCIWSA